MLVLNLEGKTALIGGSTQGIGLAIAQELATQNANCILISRSEEKLKHAVSTLNTDFNQKHSYLIADYSNPLQVQEVVQEYLKNNTIDILVNNTGGPAGGQIINAKFDDFINAFQQHLICNHLLMQLVAEGMKQKGFGRIINIISTSVKIPLKELGVSNTIRGAVASWAKTMANELAKYGITVNNVLPGATTTERLEVILKNKTSKSGKTREEVESDMLAEIPAGRFGKPEEIASLVSYLASPAAAYINGTSIPVDGGRTGSI